MNTYSTDLAPQAEEDHVKQYIRDRISEAKLVMVDISEMPVPEGEEIPVAVVGKDPAEETENTEPEMLETELCAESEEAEKPVEVQAAGRRVSILNREFEAIIYRIDEMLNRALSIAVDARQGFSVTAKISLAPNGQRFSVSHNVGYKFDPIKVEDKGALYEDIAISFDRDGNLIIPDGSSRQITMEEITSGVTVTTDESGVVESVQTDDETDRVFPCDCAECPLHTGFTGEVSGCSFNGSITAPLDDDLKGHIYDAVTEHFCTRSCINEICRREFPFSKETEAEPDPYPCEEQCCWFNSESETAEGKTYCDLDKDGGHEPYMTSDADYRDAVIDCHCTRRCVLDRFEKIKGGDYDD